MSTTTSSCAGHMTAPKVVLPPYDEFISEQIDGFVHSTKTFYERRIRCASGFHLSVCNGDESLFGGSEKDANGKWKTVMIGGVRWHETLLDPYAEDDYSVPHLMIYLNVPISVLKDIIRKHNGFSSVQ